MGCASLAFSPSVQSVGEYKNTSSVAVEAAEMPEGTAADVRVLIQTLPEGMVIKDGQLTFDDRYEMLAKVSANYKNPGWAFLGFWFYGYKSSDSWRTGLCAWQVPLSWVTGSLWAFVAPTYYPCRVKMGSEEERRADIVETMQRATKALGGNLVVVGGFGGVNFITTQGGAVVATNSVDALSGEGYAFKTKTRATAPTATPVKGATKL